MARDQKPVSPVANDGDASEARDYVVLSLRESELNSLLEKALDAWRPSKLDNGIVAVIILPVVFTVIQLWGGTDPKGIRSMMVVMIGIAYILFHLGVAAGRRLRPRPSKEQLDTFARHTLKQDEIVDYIDQSKKTARAFGSIEGRIAEVGPARGQTKLCVVDYNAMLQIEQSALVVAARAIQNQSPLHVVVLGDGTPRKFWNNLSCDQCGITLQPNQIGAHCDSHGGLFCKICAADRTKAAQAAGTPILCKSCAVGIHPSQPI